VPAAPYLGNRMLIGEIARAPLAAWTPGQLAESTKHAEYGVHTNTAYRLAALVFGNGREDHWRKRID